MLKQIKSYAVGIAIPVAVGLLSAFLTKDSMDLYGELVKPALAPPAVLFPIVWTVLYILMGVSSTMVYNSASEPKEKSRALFVYSLQLLVNFFWSTLFFTQRAFLLSFLWLILLWGLILLMILRFRRINESAALLQVPYLLWVTFAGYLNLAIYLLS